MEENDVRAHAPPAGSDRDLFLKQGDQLDQSIQMTNLFSVNASWKHRSSYRMQRRTNGRDRCYRPHWTEAADALNERWRRIEGVRAFVPLVVIGHRSMHRHELFVLGKLNPIQSLFN
jgi:hypothetical protein